MKKSIQKINNVATQQAIQDFRLSKFSSFFRIFYQMFRKRMFDCSRTLQKLRMSRLRIKSYHIKLLKIINLFDGLPGLGFTLCAGGTYLRSPRHGETFNYTTNKFHIFEEYKKKILKKILFCLDI